MSINKSIISGNLTRDAELRATAAGNPVCSFGVAVNDRRRNQNGEWEDYANFVDCQLFGRRAEAVAQYLTKGTKVAIEGRLHYSSWEDRNGGGRRSKLEVYVDELEFMSGRSSSQNAAGGQQRQQQPSYYPQQQNGPQSSYQAQQGAFAGQQQSFQSAAYSDDDIPF